MVDEDEEEPGNGRDAGTAGGGSEILVGEIVFVLSVAAGWEVAGSAAGASAAT